MDVIQPEVMCNTIAGDRRSLNRERPPECYTALGTPKDSLMTLLPVRLVGAAIAFWTAFSTAHAACRPENFEGNRYTVCSFDLARTDMRMFWRTGEGSPFRTFSTLAETLARDGEELVFAMNGGMYADDFSPIGLYIENGSELKAANTTALTGPPAQIPNFYKKPNGIFFSNGDSAGILTTEEFLEARPQVDYATQSGPMLVIAGAVHPMFIEGSTDRKQRNGVGVSSPKEVHFAISEGRVNFHDFARFFRDRLGCKDALFLDGGSAPGLYAPELSRDDAPGHGGYGPIIAVVGE